MYYEDFLNSAGYKHLHRALKSKRMHGFQWGTGVNDKQGLYNTFVQKLKLGILWNGGSPKGRFWNGNTLYSNEITLSDWETNRFYNSASNLAFIKNYAKVKANTPFKSSDLIYTSVKDEGEINKRTNQRMWRNEHKPRLELPLTTVMVLSKLLPEVRTSLSPASADSFTPPSLPLRVIIQHSYSWK